VKDLFYFFAGGLIVFFWACVFAFLSWIRERGK